MNREVHVRICESRGLRCPRLLDNLVITDWDDHPLRTEALVDQ
jgi:hypothetical protein